MHHPLAALGVDIDGTLYPCSDEQFTGWSDRAESFVQEVTGLCATDAREVADRFYKEKGSTLCGMLAAGYEFSVQDFFDRVHDPILTEHLAQDTVLDDELSCIDLPKFAFTNGDVRHAQRVLTRLGIQRHFPEIVHVETMELRAKPNPYAFEVLLRRMGDALGRVVRAEEVGIIEDSIPNIRAAKQLGFRTMYVRHGRPAEDDAIDTAIDTIHDIREGLDALRLR